MEFNLTNIPHSKISADMKPTKVTILILGSGPAGLSAALYAARAEMNPLILAGIQLGGQVSLTYTVENYPGFPDGVGGAQLVELFQKQAERFGAKVEFDSALEVKLSQSPFYVKAYQSEYLAESLIIATGATPVKLNIPGEIEFTGKGVSYCATCDGWFFKEKNVVVIGGGDSALEEAIFLTRYAKSVTIIHRRDQLRAGAILQKRALGNEKIKFIWNSIVTEIKGDNTVNAVKVMNKNTGQIEEMPIDGIFIFVGHVPNTELFIGQLEMDERNYIISNREMRTNVPGVFVAGEVADPYFRQVITSAGMGAAAAMQAIHYIQAKQQDIV